MRSIIPKCRFNARGTPNFGLILTGGVLVLTLGEPGTVRPEGDAKPLDRATATGASVGEEEGGRLFDGDFGMPGRSTRLLRSAKRLAKTLACRRCWVEVRDNG
tara:strand:+ start:195 stop:503 length:309 start_codon:yes stop_codon:yes gene_type:complete